MSLSLFGTFSASVFGSTTPYFYLRMWHCVPILNRNQFRGSTCQISSGTISQKICTHVACILPLLISHYILFLLLDIPLSYPFHHHHLPPHFIPLTSVSLQLCRHTALRSFDSNPPFPKQHLQSEPLNSQNLQSLITPKLTNTPSLTPLHPPLTKKKCAQPT